MRRLAVVALVVLGWALVVMGIAGGIRNSESAAEEPLMIRVPETALMPGASTTEGDTKRETAASTPETSTATTIEPVDYPNPVRLEIPSQGIAAEIDGTGPAFDRLVFNPLRNRLDWWLDDQTVGPCEDGSVFILGHVTDKFRNLVDDPEISDDSGVSTGDVVYVRLIDYTVCVYRVVEFESEFGEEVPGTPARRFVKDDWASRDWSNVIRENGSEPTLFLLTSGGTVFETVNGERHRVYADVVKTVLEEIVPLEWRDDRR